MTRVFVTGVGDVLGIAIIKSLNIFEEIKVHGGDFDKLAPGFFVNGLEDSVVSPHAKKNVYKEFLFNYCISNDIDVFIPGSEAEIIKVSKFKKEFDNIKTNILLPDIDILEIAAYKDLTIKLARQANVPHPKTVIIEKGNVSEKKILNNLSFPMIIKPIRSQGGKGVERLENLNDFNYHVKKSLEKYNKCLIQELIPGETGSMYLFATVVSKEHQLKTVYVSRSLKTEYEWGGPALAGITIREKEVIRLGKKVVNSLEKWVGPIMIEFMLDPRDDSFKLIEINPRLWGYNYLATGSGINFPKLVVDLALEKNVPYFDDFAENKILIRVPNDIILEKSEVF